MRERDWTLVLSSSIGATDLIRLLFPFDLSMDLQNTVKEALTALYHHPDDAVRMQADRYLQDFQRTLDAWQVLSSIRYLLPQFIYFRRGFVFLFVVLCPDLIFSQWLDNYPVCPCFSFPVIDLLIVVVLQLWTSLWGLFSCVLWLFLFPYLFDIKETSCFICLNLELYNWMQRQNFKTYRTNVYYFDLCRWLITYFMIPVAI